MSVVGDRHARRFRQHVRGGAVPLGQHSHSPEQVMPLRGRPADLPDEVALIPTGYARLPAPAPTAWGCACCPSSAALIDPATGHAYCTDCWMSAVVCGQLD